MRFLSSLQLITEVRAARLIAMAAALCAAIALAGCSSAGGAAAPVPPASAKNSPFASDPQVREVLANSCFDCHGSGGSGGFLAKLAPSYMFGSGKAHEALNFSDWSEYDPTQRRKVAGKIVEEIENGSMPPGDYEFLHPSADLSDAQKQLVVQWAHHQEAMAAH